MKKLLLLLAAAAALCVPSSAQNTTITASHLKMMGADITVGKVIFTPVNIFEQAIPFSDGSGAQNGPMAFACNIVSGAITTMVQPDGTGSGTCQIPDSTLTLPVNIQYDITVTNTSTGLSTSGKFYNLPRVVGIAGSTWPLDHYGSPAQTTNIQALLTSHGTSTPSSCVAGQVFVNDTTGTLKLCVGGVFVGTSVTWPLSPPR